MDYVISEKEFAVISELSNNKFSNQRTLARKLGISLGLTNLIIKRLLKMGYLKSMQLNAKKVQYILTPKGFAEKAQKSYFYTLRTIKLLKAIKETIREEILNQYALGRNNFIILGDNELAYLVIEVFKTISAPGIKYFLNDKTRMNTDTAFIYCRENEVSDRAGINIIARLAEQNLFL